MTGEWPFAVKDRAGTARKGSVAWVWMDWFEGLCSIEVIVCGVKGSLEPWQFGSHHSVTQLPSQNPEKGSGLLGGPSPVSCFWSADCRGWGCLAGWAVCFCGVVAARFGEWTRKTGGCEARRSGRRWAEKDRVPKRVKNGFRNG